MVNIYDRIAALCACLIRANEADELFVHYSCIAEQAKADLRQAIAEQLPMLFEANQTNEVLSYPAVRRLGEQDLNESFYQVLEACLTFYRDRQAYFALMVLLQVLDESLQDLLRQQIADGQADSFSTVLNSNREATGIGLLPRTSCMWERKHRLIRHYDRLDGFLDHLLLLEHTILGELIDKHIFLKSDLFPDLARTNALKIAASPLRRDPHYTLECYEKERVSYVRVRYPMAERAADNETVWEKIQAAAREHADIIVFPELLGNPDLTAYLVQRIQALSPEERQRLPSLMFLPSVWDKQMNTVTVLDKHGHVLCRQSKQNPFRLVRGTQGYLEDIRISHVVNIFHHEGIGRIGILICRDFLTTPYMERLMRCFKLTLILVPSCSTGSYDFRQALDLCAHDDCNVVWLNTCAALEKGKEDNFESIGYVRKRIGRREDDSQRLYKMPVCEGAFRGECSHDCLFFETIQGV